jgi:hypothetical protein
MANMQETTLPLKDIHLPLEINWWPPAYGWWLLIAGLVVVSAFVYWMYYLFTRNTTIKTAKNKLDTIRKNNGHNEFQKLCELSVLIRRVAISLSPREHVASLTGKAWLAWLDSSVKGSPFSEGVGQFLASAHYRNIPVTEQEIQQLISLCEDWLKAQKTKSKNS